MYQIFVVTFKRAFSVIEKKHQTIINKIRVWNRDFLRVSVGSRNLLIKIFKLIRSLMSIRNTGVIYSFILP